MTDAGGERVAGSRVPTWDTEHDDLAISDADIVGTWNEVDMDAAFIPRAAAERFLLPLIGPDETSAALGGGDLSLDALFGALQESRVLQIIVMDWRGVLSDELEFWTKHWRRMGIDARFESTHPDGCTATVFWNGSSIDVGYNPSNGEDFHDVVRAFNRLLAGRIEYRADTSSEGSDTWSHTGASPETWRELEATFPVLTEALFTRLDEVESD